MGVCLAIAAVLGIQYWYGFQDYRGHVQQLFDDHQAALETVKTPAEAESYIAFVAPELLKERDRLRNLYWVYLGFSLLGVPKPTKKTLRSAYISLREGRLGGVT